MCERNSVYIPSLFYCNLYAFVQDVRQADAIKKLSNQVALHNAQVNNYTAQINTLQNAKLVCLKNKDMNAAKAKVREKHKIIANRQRSEQLASMCQRMLDSIRDGDTIKNTVGVLNEVQMLFRGVRMDEYYNQIGSITDTLGEFRSDMEDGDSLIRASNEVNDSELEAELEAMLKGDTDGEGSAVTYDMPVAPTGIPVLSRPGPAEMTRERKLASMYIGES